MGGWGKAGGGGGLEGPFMWLLRTVPPVKKLVTFILKFNKS